MAAETSRRNFIAGAAAIGAACGVQAGTAGRTLAFPSCTGKEFQGMDGVYAALFTPFGKDGSLNEEMVEKEIEYGLRNGLRGFYLTGGTGEGLNMTFDERVRVYRRAVKAANGRAKLIAHVGCINSNEAAKLARSAADAGCDWVKGDPFLLADNNY